MPLSFNQKLSTIKISTKEPIEKGEFEVCHFSSAILGADLSGFASKNCCLPVVILVNVEGVSSRFQQRFQGS